jgi:hypothetical protein
VYASIILARRLVLRNDGANKIELGSFLVGGGLGGLFFIVLHRFFPLAFLSWNELLSSLLNLNKKAS